MMNFSFPVPEENSTFNSRRTPSIFDRSSFGKTLTRIVANLESPLTISLEAKWGEGKTTFIYQWKNQLAAEAEKVSQQAHCIYIDAYKNDYQKDPFLLIASSIYTYAEKHLVTENNTPNKEFLGACKKVGGALAKAATKSALQAVTLNTVNSDSIDQFEQNFDKELGKVADAYIDNALRSHADDTKSFEGLKATLADLAHTLKDGSTIPLIIIIDELDRCRPTFALEVLETIKHLFSAPSVCFILVNNPIQLQESVRHQYGAKTDANGYLRKFFDLSLKLPKAESSKDQQFNDTKNFINNTFQHIGGLARANDFATSLTPLVLYCDLTLRDTQKVCLYIVLVDINAQPSRCSVQKYSNIVCGLAILSLNNRDFIEKIHGRAVTDMVEFKERMNDSKTRYSLPQGFSENWNDVFTADVNRSSDGYQYSPPTWVEQIAGNFLNITL